MKQVTQLLFAGTFLMLAACQSKTTTTEATVKTDSTKTDSVKTDTVKKEVAAAGTTKTGDIKAKDFHIDTPEGWASQENTIQGRSMVFMIAPAKDGYKSNLNVLKDAMKGESLDDYIKISLAKMQSMKIALGDSGDMIVDGMKGKYLKYIYNYQGQNIAVKTYIFPKNDIAYIITASTLPELGKEFEPVFDKAVNSFTVK